MPVLARKTIANEVQDELSAALVSVRSYLSEDNEKYRAWDNRITKLSFADPGIAQISWSILALLTGDLEQVELHIDRARSRRVAEVHCIAAEATAFSTLLRATRLQALARKQSHAGLFSVSELVEMLVGAGGYRLASSIIAAAQARGENVSEIEGRELFQQVEALFPDVPDELFAKTIDVAGEVLARHRIFWCGSQLSMRYDNETHCIGVRYPVWVSASVATSMTLEVIDLLIERNLHDVPLTLGFVGVAEGGTESN